MALHIGRPALEDFMLVEMYQLIYRLQHTISQSSSPIASKSPKLVILVQPFNAVSPFLYKVLIKVTNSIRDENIQSPKLFNCSLNHILTVGLETRILRRESLY